MAVIAILIAPDAEWPEKHEEDYRAYLAQKQNKMTLELSAEIEKDKEGLKAFKNWVNNKKHRRTFKDPRYASLLEKVKAIFEKGKTRHIDVETRVAAAEAFDQANQSRLRTPKDVDYWVKVPGGNFSIGRFPVTVWEYRKYLDAKPEAKQPNDWEDQLLHLSRPVTQVSWDDAQGYCMWADCKLPTEEQWKLAAYGDESRKYPWGQDAPDVHRANFNRRGNGPSPVGMFPDGNTPEEVADMAGSVWEWTLTSEGTSKMSRGASYFDDASFLRAAYRFWVEPGDCVDFLGFRCLRE